MEAPHRKWTIFGTWRAAPGFTLLELIIVLLLIGLLLVVSVPTLRNSLIDDPLTATARRLIGYLDGVRDLAVREQQGYLVVVDLDENRIWHHPEQTAVADRDAAPPETGVFAPAAGVRLRDIWQRGTGAVSGGTPEVWISRQGYLERTAWHLEDGDGKVLSLLVVPFLPGVEVREGYYEPEEDKR